MRKNRILFLTSLLAVTCLASCNGGGNKSSAPADSSSDFSSSEAASSQASSSSEAISSSEAASSSSAASSSQSSSSSFNPGPTPITLPEPDVTEEFDNSKDYLPDEILLNHRFASILVNEEYQLSPIAQYRYDGSNLQYESADPSIVTVSDNGLLKGIKAGKTNVLVSDKDHPELQYTLPVTVNAELSADAAASLAEDLDAIDESGFNQIVDLELYEKSVYRAGELIRYDRFDQRMVGSVPDGYFRIWETDCEVKTQQGAADFTNYEWIFHTNRFYDTYIYHTTGNTNNYLRVPTQSYMDAGSRIAPVNEILDNIFTSGSEIFTNMFDNAKLSRFTDMITEDYSNVTNKKIGSNGDGQCVFVCDISFPNETADQDDETRYGIPFGTKMPAVQGMRYIVENNRMIGYTVHLTCEYEIDGVKYNEVYDIDHKYEEFTAERVFDPDKTTYTQVFDLFDL